MLAINITKDDGLVYKSVTFGCVCVYVMIHVVLSCMMPL